MKIEGANGARANPIPLRDEAKTTALGTVLSWSAYEWVQDAVVSLHYIDCTKLSPRRAASNGRLRA
jgi:hypothetical protein